MAPPLLLSVLDSRSLLPLLDGGDSLCLDGSGFLFTLPDEVQIAFCGCCRLNISMREFLEVTLLGYVFIS